MSNITKDLAIRIARDLTSGKEDEIKKLKESLQSQVTDIYLKTIPVEVINFFEKNPSYTQGAHQIRILNTTWDFRYLTIKGKVPCSGGEARVTFDPKTDGKLLKIQNNIELKQEQLKQLRRKIESGLLSLRTFKRVRENFPEAAEYLPEDKSGVNTSLIVDLQSVRAEINQ